jgi:tetratricopeptide (TPR) repeat protein
MRRWNSLPPTDRATAPVLFLIFTGVFASASVTAGDAPAPAKGEPAAAAFAVGSEVVLKLPELPIFDEGRMLSAEDHLTLTVEKSEGGRLVVVSRDKQTRGWVYQDEVVPLEKAKDYFDHAVLNDFRNPDVSWVLGRLYLYQNDDDRALVNLNRAVRQPPDQARFYLSRSLVLLRKRRFREALADCERVLRLDPESSKGRLVYEKAQLARQNDESALAGLEQAFRLDPTNPFPPAARSAQQEAGERGGLRPGVADRTADDPEPAARPVPHTTAEFLESGQRCYDQQEYDKAMSDFDAALKVDPKCAQAYIARARTWVQKHYRERELADIDAAISLEPGNASYRVARAESWSARGMNAPAMVDYAEAIRLDPANPAIWVSRGNEWRKDHKVDLAIADYTQAIRLDPKYTPAYIARANVWKQIRRFDRAIQEYSELIRLDPDNPVAHVTLARILATAQEDQYRNGKWALQEAARACELTHWIDPDAFDTLAAASAETGDFESAIKWQNLAIKLVRQRFASALQKKAVSMGGGRGIGVGFDDRLAFYKSKKPIRE